MQSPEESYFHQENSYSELLNRCVLSFTSQLLQEYNLNVLDTLVLPLSEYKNSIYTYVSELLGINKNHLEANERLLGKINVSPLLSSIVEVLKFVNIYKEELAQIRFESLSRQTEPHCILPLQKMLFLKNEIRGNSDLIVRHGEKISPVELLQDIDFLYEVSEMIPGIELMENKLCFVLRSPENSIIENDEESTTEEKNSYLIVSNGEKNNFLAQIFLIDHMYLKYFLVEEVKNLLQEKIDSVISMFQDLALEKNKRLAIQSESKEVLMSFIFRSIQNKCGKDTSSRLEISHRKNQPFQDNGDMNSDSLERGQTSEQLFLVNISRHNPGALHFSWKSKESGIDIGYGFRMKPHITWRACEVKLDEQGKLLYRIPLADQSPEAGWFSDPNTAESALQIADLFDEILTPQKAGTVKIPKTLVIGNKLPVTTSLN